MSFIQQCFIKKNTSELRKYLYSIGYEEYPYQTLDSNGYLRAEVYEDGYFNGIDWITTGTIPNYYTINDEDLKEDKEEYIDDIDCGDNEELFKAISALRDDNDYMQWFISNDNSMFLCTLDNVKDFIHEKMDEWNCDDFRKATVEELIKKLK